MRTLIIMLLLLAAATAHASAEATTSMDVSPTAPEAVVAEPFSFGDFTWMNGTNRQKTPLLASKYFTGSLLLDVNYTYSFNHPIDDTVVGSTALARNNELEVAFLGFGGDFAYEHARARIMTQFGARSTVVPRNDSSADRGQFDLRSAYRYISEAYGGYHFDVMHGMNVDVGIFMSYVGLFSFDNFENWSYQPSFTSDNTPWFFNGARVQLFPTDRLKLELWLINGWQTYGKFNDLPGVGGQVTWRPQEWLSLVSNNYVGTDTANAPGRLRVHTDESFLMRYYQNERRFLTRAAFSVTADFGFETGDGVTAFGGKDGPAQHFISAMAYHRVWFAQDKFAWTVGGGFMQNPGRYLVLLPTGVAGSQFDTSAGTQFDAWDASTTLDWMPDNFQTWRIEFVHREASVPYFAGRGGVTGPTGYTTATVPVDWKPDLSKQDTRIVGALLLRF